MGPLCVSWVVLEDSVKHFLKGQVAVKHRRLESPKNSASSGTAIGLKFHLGADLSPVNQKPGSKPRT